MKVQNHNAEHALPSMPLMALPCAIGFFFCVRNALTLVGVRVFDGPPQLGAALSLAVELSLLALVCVDLLRPKELASLSVKPVSSVRGWVFVYVAFAGVSLLWTAAASPPASLAYWSGTACDVAMISLQFRRSDPQRVSFSVMRGFVFGACIIAVTSWLMPAQYDLRLGDEDYLNANTIANLCAFGFFLSLILRRSGAGKYRAVSALLAITTLRTLSKATIAAFAVSTAFLLIQDRSISSRKKLALTLLAFFVLMLFWGLFEAYYDVYTTTGNQALTLTGRTAIWAYVADNLPEHPWIGHGFDSMWKTVPSFGTFEPRHAENEVLQQLYAYGIAGLLLLVAVYSSLYRCIRRLANHPVRLIVLSMLVFVLVRGMAEAEPFDLLLPLWMVVLLSTFADCLRATYPAIETGSNPEFFEPSFDNVSTETSGA
jgi:hypothetical protein